jgi:hypothetical protein
MPVAAPFGYSGTEFASPQRGIASLTFSGRTWRFRTNPNTITWSYSLVTNTDQTYGGRVIQILATKIDDLIVRVECGNGGWAYNEALVLFIRDLLVSQRNPMAPPATFEYTTRNWKFNVYGLSIPFQDQVTATVRELELHFKVQEDVSGVVSGAILDATLAQMQDGIGFTRNQYNSVNAPFSWNGQTSSGTPPPAAAPLPAPKPTDPAITGPTTTIPTPPTTPAVPNPATNPSAGQTFQPGVGGHGLPALPPGASWVENPDGTYTMVNVPTGTGPFI